MDKKLVAKFNEEYKSFCKEHGIKAHLAIALWRIMKTWQ